MLAALLLVSLLVALLAALTGLLILSDRAAASASHPLVSAGVSGLLVGVGALVLLPEAISDLVDCRHWPAERLMLLFLLAMLAVFAVDHLLMPEHEHLVYTAQPKKDFFGKLSPATPAPPLPPPPTTATPACLPCEPCEPCEPSEARAWSGSFWAQPRGCPCDGCDDTPLPPPVFSPHPTDAARRVANADAGDETLSNWAQRARMCSVALRMVAWMLHAMIDGMLLSTADSLLVLCATALPVSLCAIQDVAAFTLSMMKVGCTKQQLAVGVVFFSACFPLGAIGSYLSYESSRSRLVVLVMRCAVAAIFVYMALFEIKPRPATTRAEGLQHLLTFVVGAACAFCVELVEDMATSDSGDAEATVNSSLAL